MPWSKTTINLAPGHTRKEGPCYDLPIAIGLLAATGQLEAQVFQNYLIAGELSLSGATRAVRGALAMGRLAAAGLAQYEISNVARQGHESRHNLKYWHDTGWLAVGCGAHGSREGRRWSHVADTGAYVDRVMAGADPTGQSRHLDRTQQLAEALFMGLRLVEGIDLAAFRARFDVDVWDRYGDALAPASEAGLLERVSGRIRLTRRGMLLANEVMQVFV